MIRWFGDFLPRVVHFEITAEEPEQLAEEQVIELRTSFEKENQLVWDSVFEEV